MAAAPPDDAAHALSVAWTIFGVVASLLIALLVAVAAMVIVRRRGRTPGRTRPVDEAGPDPWAEAGRRARTHD